MTKGRQAPPRLIIQPTSRIRKNPDDSLGAQEAGKDIQNVDLAAVAENLEAEKSHDALEDTKNALRKLTVYKRVEKRPSLLTTQPAGIPTEKYEHATDKHSFNSKHEQEQVPLSSRVRFSRGASLEIGRALGMQKPHTPFLPYRPTSPQSIHSGYSYADLASRNATSPRRTLLRKPISIPTARSGRLASYR